MNQISCRKKNFTRRQPLGINCEKLTGNPEIVKQLSSQKHTKFVKQHEFCQHHYRAIMN